MKIAKLSADRPKVFALIFDAGDNVTAGLDDAARELELAGASFTGIGALSKVELGFFDRSVKDYKSIPVDEQVEVLALTGNIAAHNDELKVHAHIVVGKSDGSVMGGHLMSGEVWPTLEIVVTEPESKLRRRFDDKAQLPLIDLESNGLTTRVLEP